VASGKPSFTGTPNLSAPSHPARRRLCPRCLGHVLAAHELCGQCRQLGLAPEAIVLATGSGGTHAGRLVAGPEVAVDGRLYCWINFEMP
jgi:hypothetical protein